MTYDFFEHRKNSSFVNFFCMYFCGSSFRLFFLKTKQAAYSSPKCELAQIFKQLLSGTIQKSWSRATIYEANSKIR